MLGGLALLLGGLGLGLALSSHQVESQGAYEAPVIPGRAVTRRTSASREPKARPAPIKSDVAPVGSTSLPPPSPEASMSDPPPVVAGQPSPVAAPDPSSRTGPTPAPSTPVVSEVGFCLSGADAPAIAEAVTALLRTKASEGSTLARCRVFASEKEAPPLEGARAVVAVEATGLRVRHVSAPSPDLDVVAALIPPVGLVGEALEGFLLPVGGRFRTPTLAALCALLANDWDAGLSLLDGVGNDAGVRVLVSYARLARKELPAVHRGLLGLGTDADVGPVARFLTGAALLVDGNAREALRDFAAAIASRPGYWPARLLAGTANDRLALPEAARDQFAAVLAAAPGRPEAVIGYAPHLAETDRPAAIGLVERLLAERPTLVPGWWQLAWLRRKGDTSEDLQKGIEALERVVALRPADADAWGALGGAHWRWAGSGGGVLAFSEASAAFAKQCELTPDDGLAWFSQAATLHEVALKTPLDGDAGALSKRVAATAAIYGKALAKGLPRSDAARVQFNLGLLLDAVPVWPEGTVPAGLPRRAADAYAAALEADPGYAEAALRLLAARIGDRDVKEALTVIAALPPGIDPKERAVLEAALAHVKGDPAGATRLLTGPARVIVPGADPLTPLARELLLLGYRRLVVSLLASEMRDPARIALRVRARAGLGEVEATTNDLATLRTLDTPRSEDLRRNDQEVRRTLGVSLSR